MVFTHDLLGFSPMRSRVHQVPPTRRQQTAFHPSSPAPIFAGDGTQRGGQHLGHPPGTTLPHQFTQPGIVSSQMVTQHSVVPIPTLSLQIRLKEMAPALLQSKEERLSMKSVDLLADNFDLVFSGESGQDWMNHVNELERQQAVKHQWIPRQFYFALSITPPAPKFPVTLTKN